jgi:Tol biopolymer transport system component
VKILDFGLAKLQGLSPVGQEGVADRPGEGNSSVPTLLQTTQAGVVLGTPAYMSPEQVLGKPADHRSDIFAVGCVLYEMLMGKGAFRRDTPVESMNAVLKEEAPDLSATHPSISPAMERIVQRCLEKEPERRFQSASDLAFALESLTASNFTGATQIAPVRTALRVRRILPWAVAAVCFGAALILSFQRKNGPVEDRTALAPVRKIELHLPVPSLRLSDDQQLHATISPDGRKIAFATSDGLWVRWLDRLGAPVHLVGGESIVRPFWSPDSKAVGFFQGRRLARVSLDGEKSITLAAVPDHNLVGSEGAAWLQDDQIVFASGFSGVNQVPAEGGPVKTLWQPNPSAGEHDLHGVAALPGSRGVLVEVHRKAGVDTIAVLTRAGQRKFLLQMPGEIIRHPVFSPTGHVIFERTGEAQGIWAFRFSLDRLERTGEPFRVSEAGHIPSVSNNGTLVCGSEPDAMYSPRQLVWLDQMGKVLGPVGPILPTLAYPRLSPDGRRILAIAGDSFQALEVVLIDTDASAAFPLTHNHVPDLRVYWSKDGLSAVFYRIEEGGRGTSWTKAIDGTSRETPLFDGLTIPSSSGNSLLVARHLTNSVNVLEWTYVQPPATNSFPIDLAKVFGKVYDVGFSADDRWLVFSSDISGRPEIWVAEFPRLGRRQMISRDGGDSPIWRRNGQELFFTTSNGHTLMSSRLNPDQTRFEEPKKVFDIPEDIFTSTQVNVFDVSADGERFLMLRRAADAEDSRTKPNVLLIENWAAEAPSRK